MRLKKENIPVTLQAPGTIMRGLPGWGGMTVAFNEMPAGTDLGPLLQGLKNNSCQCPHWGYLLEGEITMKYDDGSEETLTAGDVFYMQPGHTGVAHKDCKLSDFSPQDELQHVMDHIARKLADFSK